jgi:hypothetical protein
VAQEAALASEAGKVHPVGAWRVFVAPEVPGGPVFVNLATLHADGTIVGIPPASPMADGTFVSGSAGVWRRAAPSEFDVLFYSTMYNGDVLVGYARIRSRIQLSSDGERFSGRFTNDILDPDDNIVFSVEGTVTGRRILPN